MTRKELQATCMKFKIPANISNANMQTALQAVVNKNVTQLHGEVVEEEDS